MIEQDLHALLAPLEEFERIRRRAARLGGRLCDMSYANPYSGVQETARQALRNALDHKRLLDLQYTPFGGHTLARRAVADDASAQHGLPYTYQDIVLTPGAMAALHIAIRAACGPGDDLLVPVPCWLDYPLYARYAGVTPVHVELTGPHFQLDLETIERHITARTTAILIANPSNPAGRCYSAESLAALAALLDDAERRIGHPITLLADETHRDFTEPGVHCPAARIRARTITIYSFGKYHFLQGQRIGYAAVAPSHDRRADVAEELVRWTRISGCCTPTALMQRAIPELLALKHDLRPVADARRWATTTLRQAGYDVTPADGTLFLYVRTPSGIDDFEFVHVMAARGVLVLPAPVFHHSRHFRISLTADRRALEAGIHTLAAFAASDATPPGNTRQ